DLQRGTERSDPMTDTGTAGAGSLASTEASEADLAAPWSARAAELTRWVLEHLAVRRDVWGGYVPEAERGREFTRADGSRDRLEATLTRPARSQRGVVLLTEEVVARHFRPRHAGDLIGLHTTSPANTCRWGGLDIDRHGEHADPAANWRAALHWHERLARRGFRPLLTDSNGAGGFHLRILFAQDVSSPRLYYFLRGLIADHARAGLPAPPEAVPKQSRIPLGRYGNWMRVFGRHHSRPHWSRVWGDGRWLEGHQAIDSILSLNGDPADLLPEDAERDARVRAYLARLPNRAE